MTSQSIEETQAVIGEGADRTLLRVLRVMYPHDGFPDGPYERTRDALLTDAAASPRLAGVIAQGVRDLDTLGERSFADLSTDEATALLERMEGSVFFEAVRSRAIATLYDDREVWTLLGYEGPSYDLGGYVGRGFDDLAWLPEPPV
jgi:hypothetical protein